MAGHFFLRGKREMGGRETRVGGGGSNKEMDVVRLLWVFVEAASRGINGWIYMDTNTGLARRWEGQRAI